MSTIFDFCVASEKTNKEFGETKQSDFDPNLLVPLYQSDFDLFEKPSPVSKATRQRWRSPK